MRGLSLLFALGAAAALAAAVGCTEDQLRFQTGPPKEHLEQNIIQVVRYYDTNPFGPVGAKPGLGGFRIKALYLLAVDETGREQGVFADGTIRVLLHVLEEQPDGTETATLVKEWDFDVDRARPYRSRKQYVLGQGYQLHCAWGDLDLSGKRVRIDIQFERVDGRIIPGKPHVFDVPTY